MFIAAKGGGIAHLRVLYNVQIATSPSAANTRALKRKSTQVRARTQRDVVQMQARIQVLEGALNAERLARERAEFKVADLLRRLYGPKADKVDPAQLALLTGQLQADDALARTPPLIATPPSLPAELKRKGGGRRPAPAHLPIERIVLDLSDEEKTGLVCIREEITEELDYRPSQFIRRHYVRPLYADPTKTQAPVMAPLPVRVLPQASVGPGLLAHLLVSKYVDHLPLARQEKIAARVGVALPRQKLGRWVEGSALLLRTIHDQLQQRIRDSGYVQADETPIKLLDPDRGGKAAQAYLWAYHAPDAQAIAFDFSTSRGRESPDRFFPEDWQGDLQSDGYDLYAALARARPGVTRFGCMAHARRKLSDALKAGDTAAASLLIAIGKLYRLERQASERGDTHAQRACLRHAHARPILRQLQRELRMLQQAVLPRSKLGEAVGYMCNQWPELARYAKADNGHIHIDNNPVERGIRPTKLGLKNWLFIGHPSAGWRSAVIYSVLGTCQLLKLNPQHYLEWVLPKLAVATTSTATGLLPHDYAALTAR